MKTAEEMIKENQAAKHYNRIINKILQKLERKIKKAMQQGFTSYDFRISSSSMLEPDDIDFIVYTLKTLGYSVKIEEKIEWLNYWDQSPRAVKILQIDWMDKIK